MRSTMTNTACRHEVAVIECDSGIDRLQPKSRRRPRQRTSATTFLIRHVATSLLVLLLSTLTTGDESPKESVSADFKAKDGQYYDFNGNIMPAWKVNMKLIKNMNSSDYTPRSHPEGWTEARSRMFAKLPMSYCRFPKFYYRNGKYHDHDLTNDYAIEDHWRARMREKLADADGAELKAKYDGRDPPPKRLAPGTPNLTRKISFLHIGEAGGTALACSLREARRYGVRRRCGKPARARFKNDDYVESALSRQVTCYMHYNYNGKCLDESKYTSFLVNVRNPIDRMRSWFLHEHFLNEPVTHPEFSKNTLHCGPLMLGSCYKNFDQLASVGLLPPRDLRSKLPIRKDLTPDECAHWAWSAIEGDIPATYHNHFNYEWYLRTLFSSSHSKPTLGNETELFVVRVEHLDDDWRTIDRMVGGTGETVPTDLTDGSPIFGSTAETHLLATNASLSEVGALNLCRALCREIQVYKMLIFRAVNIDAAGFNQSMAELRRYCPDEPDDTPRRCEYY